ncbi:MAG: DUF3754 domain-containing protein [Gemmataceae bacterium]
MAEHHDREHYIPIRKSDLVEALSLDSRLDAPERTAFRQFTRLAGAIWHFEYLEYLENIKDAYAPFDPDSVTPCLTPVSAEDRPARINALFEEFVHLMARANFIRLDRNAIAAAVEGGASDWGVNMYVDWDIFERLEIFARSEGKTLRTRTHPFFFWRKEEKTVETYRRLVILLKLKPSKRVPATIDTEAIFAKMFKDIPKLDLEMTLPGTSLQMPLTQKWKLGGSVLGTLGYGLYRVFWEMWEGILALFGLTVKLTMATATTALGILWGPFLLLGGYAYKQYAGYQVTKQTYAKMLTESLYYQSLDNNMGVVTQVLDEAEEQECRETFLAYFYLWKYAPPEGWTSEQLDDYVELDLEGRFQVKVDFEVSDALEKLAKLKIVTRTGDQYRAVPIEQALERLDDRWDNYFTYHR